MPTTGYIQYMVEASTKRHPGEAPSTTFFLDVIQDLWVSDSSLCRLPCDLEGQHPVQGGVSKRPAILRPILAATGLL